MNEMFVWFVLVISLVVNCVVGFNECEQPPQCSPCYNSNGDWLGDPWSSWTECSSKCSGTQSRQRAFNEPFYCCGCPTLQDPQKDERKCTGVNNCEHKCEESDGSCSCNQGYSLNSDGRTCSKQSCASLSTLLPTCPSAAEDRCEKLSSTCSDGNKFESTCTLQCASNFAIAKVSRESDFEFLSKANFMSGNTVTCIYDASLKWDTDVKELYCRRTNDPPRNIILSGLTIREHDPVNTVVGEVSAVDDTNSFDYSLTSEDFQLNTDNQNTVSLVNKRVISLPNGNNKIIQITIRATDQVTPKMYLDKMFSITVINVNDPPEEIMLSDSTIPNSADVDFIVGIFTAIDKDMLEPEQSTNYFLWTLTDDDEGNFKVVDGKLQVAKEFDDDFSGVRQIEVQCTDKDGLNPKSTRKTFSITVTKKNEGPQDLKLNFSSLREDTLVDAIVGFIEGEDSEKNDITFTTTSEYFSVLASSCEQMDGKFSCKAQIKLSKALNFEEKTFIQLDIIAEDSQGEKEEETFTISVSDVNEPITDINVKFENNVPSNAVDGYLVGQVEIVDEDANNNHACEILAPSSTHFTFSQQNSLNIVVKNRLVSTSREYTIKINCSDAAGGFTKEFTFTPSNPCVGRECSRDPSLCNNVVCRTDELCSIFIQSNLRCIPLNNQMRMLIPITPAEVGKRYLYNLEEYVEKVLKNEASGLSLEKLKGDTSSRKRRDVGDNIVLESIRIQIATSFYMYVSMIPRDQSTFQLQQAAPLCRKLDGTDVHCLSKSECDTLKNLGYDCPEVFANGNYGSSKAPVNDNDGSSKSWLIGVIIGGFLLFVIVVIIIFYVRRRRKHEKLYDGGVVFNNSTNRIALRTPDNQFNASNNYSVPFEDKNYVIDVKKRNDIKVVNNDIYNDDMNVKNDGTFEVTNPAYGLSAVNQAYEDSDDEKGLKPPTPHSPLYASVGKASAKSYDKILLEEASSKAKEIEDSPPTTPASSYDRLSTIDRHMSVNQYDPEIDDREKVVKQSFSES